MLPASAYLQLKVGPHRFEQKRKLLSSLRFFCSPLRFDNLPFGKPFYEFRLTATGPTGSANTLIRVMIQNANVNPPVITPLPPLQLYRQQRPGNRPFAQVAATDKDGGRVNFYFLDSGMSLLLKCYKYVCYFDVRLIHFSDKPSCE